MRRQTKLTRDSFHVFQANARKQIEALGLGVSEKVQKK